MIASLSGVLVSKSPNAIVVDVHGVGYQIFIPLSTYYRLPELNEPVTLQTYTHVREEALQLYGFLTPEEKSVFLLLLGVAGIGPKLAVNILSGLPLPEFVAAVLQGNEAKLNSIPGVGQKTAARLALELKGKIGEVAGVGAAAGEPARREDLGKMDDAVSALVNLGYKTPQAKEAVKKVLSGNNGDVSVELLIKNALRILSR
jgi:Holliday junction DNA helicase RuvA